MKIPQAIEISKVYDYNHTLAYLSEIMCIDKDYFDYYIDPDTREYKEYLTIKPLQLLDQIHTKQQIESGATIALAWLKEHYGEKFIFRM